MSDAAPKTPASGDALNRFMIAAQRELDTVSMAVKERGAERFARILILGLVAILLSYVGVYAPATKKVAGLDKRIATAKAAAQYSDRYKEARQRLDRLKALFPPAGQADNWALGRVRETLNDRNIVPDSISPPESRPANGYVQQVVHFSMAAKFPDLVAWLNDLEFGKGVIQVTALEINKQGSQEIGVNHINCTVETLVPASGAAR